MINPFSSSSLLNRPLLPEVCQRIHAQALFQTARGRNVDSVPSSIPVAQLRALLHHGGPETCLTHLTEIERLFHGMTFSVYQFIEALYCSRVARSIAMVTRVVNALARCANLSPIHAEAIWSICLHLDEQRAHMIRVTTQPSQATWWLGEIASSPLVAQAGHNPQRALVAVIDISTPAVLAFRIGWEQSITELVSLALYDALAAARYPHPSGGGGLVWIIPSSLLTTGRPPLTCTLTCTSLGVRIETCARSAVPLREDMSMYWKTLHTPGPVPTGQFIFDSILKRAYGTSPLRLREQNNHRFKQFIGYQNDPAHLVPALRALLPSHDACIRARGEIFFDGLHYTDDLLTLFPGARVSIRRSEQSEALIWVSLDGEMLGEARARELARRDGSYRAHR
jgi:hypothetical protein